MAKDLVYIFNGKIARFGNVVLGKPVDRYNPLGLPELTIRVKYKSGSVGPSYSYDWFKPTVTAVQGQSDVYDICTKDTTMGTNWQYLLEMDSNRADLLEVLGANSTGVTSMFLLFHDCTSLENVELFDTSSVTNFGSMFKGCTSLIESPLYDTSNATSMSEMFNNCRSLKYVPLFDTSTVTDMYCTFYNCVNVESGALALYQQASLRESDIYHIGTFAYCGYNTVSGSAELAQIPSSWKS